MTMPDSADRVDAAFDRFSTELDRAAADVRTSGSSAFAAGDLPAARLLLERAEAIAALRRTVDGLRCRWPDPPVDPLPLEPPLRLRHELPPTGARAERGGPTPTTAFLVPILQILVDLNGSTSFALLCSHVLQRMQHRLRPIDFTPIPTNPDRPRWKSTVSWARPELIRRGWLDSSAPRGIWAITARGRAWLAQPSDGGANTYG